MSRLERDQDQPSDPSGDATRDVAAHAAPVSDADESAAHIAELVRRTTRGQGTPGPSPLPHPDVTVAHPPPTTAPQVAIPVTSHVAPQVAIPVTSHVAPQVARQDEEVLRPSQWPPSRRVLVTAGVLVALLIGGGVALSGTFGPGDAPPPVSALESTAPAGYSVKATDQITDCADHSRGKTKASFEAENCVKATRLLATGEVGGRPVLFVVSRIEMATGEAAASVKQVLDGNGTGNLNDLLRDGKSYPGAPYEMPTSGYSSLQKGTVVTVAEAGFVDDGRSSSTDPALRSAAAEIAGMVSVRG